MKEIIISNTVLIYDTIKELTNEDNNLLKKAIEAKSKAYAPYSKFKVGAALLLKNGKIILGNNQENAAYPSGMCAERVAIWKAFSSYPNAIVKKIAITASSETFTLDKPVSPCGSCRQTLSEYEINQKEPIEILFMGEIGKIIKVNSLKTLLPFSFDNSFL